MAGEHLEGNDQLRKLYVRLRRLNRKDWWKDSVSSCSPDELRGHFDNAIYNYHVEIVQFLMTNETLRHRVLNRDFEYDDRCFVQRFVCNSHQSINSPEDVFEKKANSNI